MIINSLNKEGSGSISVVSTGPGGSRQMTPDAIDALKTADVIVGYDKYVDDIADVIEGKERFVSGMTQEIQRINQTIDYALEGKKVALVSNGDAGIYGMATLIFEIADERNISKDMPIIVLPGITSLLAAAARVGAPISQDFAVVSLSDRLTPIETIEKRLRAALQADFVLGIYNPLSRTRTIPYDIFLKLIKEFREPNCPVVIARDLDRPDEVVVISDIASICEGKMEIEVNMSTIIIVGNSTTRITARGEVLTPRGYLNKYDTVGKKK